MHKTVSIMLSLTSSVMQLLSSSLVVVLEQHISVHAFLFNGYRICIPPLLYSSSILLTSHDAYSFNSLPLLLLHLPLFVPDKAPLHSASVFFVNSPYTPFSLPQLCSVSHSVCHVFFNAFETCKSVQVGSIIKHLSCMYTEGGGEEEKRSEKRIGDGYMFRFLGGRKCPF